MLPIDVRSTFSAVPFESTSPIPCQNICLEIEECKHWNFSNYICTLSRHGSAMVFFDSLDMLSMSGGRITTTEKRKMASAALDMSVKLLEESMMNGQCNFMDLKENLPDILKLSNASVSHVENVKTFLNFNEELLVDLQAVQTIEIVSVNTNLKKINQEKNSNIAETERLKNEKEKLQRQIEEEEQKKQLFEKDKNRLSQEKYEQQRKMSKAEVNLNNTIRTMRNNEDIKRSAEASMKRAKISADKATAWLQEAEHYYERQKRLQREREERLAWSWVVHGYNVFSWVDAGLGADKVNQARNYRNDVHHSYNQARSYFRNAESNYGHARNQYWAAVKQQRISKDRMDYLSREVSHVASLILHKQLFISSAMKQRNAMINNLASAQFKIVTLTAKRGTLLKKMETLKSQKVALKEKNELINKELDVVTELQNIIVEVNIIIVTVNAQLMHSQKMAKGTFEWTPDNYEIVDLVLIGIEDALREMKIYQVGDGIPKKLLSKIKDCKKNSEFTLGLDDLDR